MVYWKEAKAGTGFKYSKRPQNRLRDSRATLTVTKRENGTELHAAGRNSRVVHSSVAVVNIKQDKGGQCTIANLNQIHLACLSLGNSEPQSLATTVLLIGVAAILENGEVEVAAEAHIEGEKYDRRGDDLNH